MNKIKLEKIVTDIKIEWYNTNETFAMSGICFLLGAGLGAIGKATNEPVIPVIPVVLNLSGRTTPYTLPYLAGVAINYVPEIYHACNLLQNFYK